MASGKFVSYLRVSTARQGVSGLGIEAQRAAVSSYLNGGDWQLIAEFVEVESGKVSDRPKLAAALRAARVHGATLVIAKLDRLSRDAHFLLGLDKAGVDFVCADMPNANRLTVGIMAMVAEEERRMISARTKAALAAAKARGVILGGRRISSGAKTVPAGETPTLNDGARAKGLAVRRAAAAAKAADLRELIADIQAAGVTSASGIAKALSERAVPTPRGGGSWQAIQVQRLLAAGP